METGLIPAQLSIVPAPSIALVPQSLNPLVPTVAPSSIRIVEVLNPFQPSRHRVEQIKALENESLGALVTRAGFTMEKYTASIGGTRIEDAEDLAHRAPGRARDRAFSARLRRQNV